MKRIKNNIQLYLKIAMTIVVAIIVFYQIENRIAMNMDDVVYKSVFNNFDSFKIWAWEFYHIWSGRIITSALSNLFLRMPIIVVKISNVGVYLIAIFAIFKIVKYFAKINNSTIETIILATIYILSFIVPRAVVDSGMMWVTGSFNYLWPTAFMFVALIPFIRRITDNEKKESKFLFLIYIFADFIACFAEQTALVLTTMATITILYMLISKKKIDKLLLIHYVIIILITLIETLAPGNFVRFNASTLRRYPSFNMLNMGDKMLQGLILTISQILTDDKKILMALTLLICIKNLMRKNILKTIKVFSAIPLIYCIISYIGSKVGIGEKIVYNLTYFGIEYIYGLKIYIPILLGTINLVLIIVLILYSFDNIKTGILSCLFFLGGLASTMTISASPTIYASGSRVFFLMDCMFIVVIGIFAMQICNEKYMTITKKKLKRSKGYKNDK